MSGTIKNTYRYPGVTPFSTEQEAIFFGRDEDTRQLFRLIQRNPLTVLHGKSGLGKSSLVNAGLIPHMREQETYQSLKIRLGAWGGGDILSPLENTKGQLRKGLSGQSLLDKLLPDDDSLWALAKQRQLQFERRPLLIFDQFEELFSYPEEAISEFKLALTELLFTGIPLRFRRILEGLDDQQELSEEEEEKLDEALNTRIVFVIRSDRLHLLGRLNDELPGILRNCYELKALTEDDARQAIQAPAAMEGGFISASFSYTEPALERLLTFLRNEDDGRVEGILIQMLCEYYEKQCVIDGGLRQLGIQEIGEPETVVVNYYEDKVAGLSEKDQAPARRLIEEGLVSEGEEMRLSLHQAYILQEFRVEEELLAHLVDIRLLRSEPFLRGGYTYELSHDRLMPAVIQARNNRRAAEAQAEAEQIKAEAERTKQQLSRVRRLLVLAVVGFVVALAGVTGALWAYQQAQEAKDAAEISQVRAEQALENFQLEQAAKERLKFESLNGRAQTILDAGGCPFEILQEMRDIADNHRDSTSLRQVIDTIALDRNCQ